MKSLCKHEQVQWVVVGDSAGTHAAYAVLEFPLSEPQMCGQSHDLPHRTLLIAPCFPPKAIIMASMRPSGSVLLASAARVHDRAGTIALPPNTAVWLLED